MTAKESQSNSTLYMCVHQRNVLCAMYNVDAHPKVVGED